jgi:acetyltransferase EpsM
MPKKVLCLGGVGDPASIGKAIVDANRRGDHGFEFEGFLNDRIETGSLLEGYPILGTLDEVMKFVQQGYLIINAIHRIDGNERRIKRIEGLSIPESCLATFVHPTAYVAPDVRLSPGCVIMPNCSISPQVRFEKCCIVLQGASVGHNTILGKYCHISAQACVGARVTLGKGVHIGMNATVLQNTTVGDYSTLGMGSSLTRSIGSKEVWFGMPAKFLRRPGEI